MGCTSSLFGSLGLARHESKSHHVRPVRQTRVPVAPPLSSSAKGKERAAPPLPTKEEPDLSTPPISPISEAPSTPTGSRRLGVQAREPRSMIEKRKLQKRRDSGQPLPGVFGAVRAEHEGAARSQAMARGASGQTMSDDGLMDLEAFMVDCLRTDAAKGMFSNKLPFPGRRPSALQAEEPYLPPQGPLRAVQPFPTVQRASIFPTKPASPRAPSIPRASPIVEAPPETPPASPTPAASTRQSSPAPTPRSSSPLPPVPNPSGTQKSPQEASPFDSSTLPPPPPPVIAQGRRQSVGKTLLNILNPSSTPSSRRSSPSSTKDSAKSENVRTWLHNVQPDEGGEGEKGEEARGRSVATLGAPIHLDEKP